MRIQNKFFNLLVLATTLTVSSPALATDVQIKITNQAQPAICSLPDLDTTIVNRREVQSEECTKETNFTKSFVDDLYLGLTWRLYPKLSAPVKITQPNRYAFIAGDDMDWCGEADLSPTKVAIKVWFGPKSDLKKCQKRPDDSIYARGFVLEGEGRGRYKIKKVCLQTKMNEYCTEHSKLTEIGQKNVRWFIDRILPRILDEGEDEKVKLVSFKVRN